LNIRTDLQVDQITIMSVEGRVVTTLNNPSQFEQINTSKFPSGTYFVRIEQQGAAWTTRFIKI
jgi:hypothetical protein